MCSDLLAWWTPPRRHPMFFSDGAEDRQAINGATFLIPPWCGRYSVAVCF
jgi:hypothetical protein